MPEELDHLTLGQRVDKLRKARGLTQARLAKRAGVSRNHVWRIIHEERVDISPRVLEGLAGALGVTVDELLGREALPEVPAPWLLALGARIDALPAELGRQVRDLMERLTTVVEQPLVQYAAKLDDLLAQTTDLSVDDLQAVTEFALGRLAQPAQPDADPGARVAGQSG